MVTILKEREALKVQIQKQKERKAKQQKTRYPNTPMIITKARKTEELKQNQYILFKLAIC